MNEITKVKYDGERVEIHYTANDGRHAIKLVSADMPTAGFLQALQDFSGGALEILELPAGYATALTIRGVSLSYDDDGERKATITAMKALSRTDTPATFNTPHGCAFTNDETLIDELVKQAQLYIAGRRKQGMFDFGEESEPELAAAANA